MIAVLPGTAICGAIALAAIAIQFAEERVSRHPYVEALVLAILLGGAIRSAWQPGPSFLAGIAFSGKFLLEVAVMLLGASISLGAIAASGPALLAGIVATVVLAIAASYAICQLLGLPQRISILIACGNSICGNSAIAAVAPVIGATGDDIASSIAFTAILGVVVVLALPLTFLVVDLNQTQYGALAGLTVYAVPQVLAATVPIGLVATQVGTLVKLVRVLMLGPVVVALSLVAPRLEGPSGTPVKHKPGLSRLVPWFIIGFLLLAALRSLQLIPDAATAPVTRTAALLTVVSMAALGLGVDVRVLANVGGKVTAAVTLSLMLLLAMSIALVHVFT
jgi:uncharacterized integral membrane protein (TIGR00698 family)